ncbi:MAG TPA: extracellular solute-binding protein [Thermomicrobiaceae bacterium]|nr:extracellular solute-binding protein [Thermomicrobiaceae bacterium]
MSFGRTRALVAACAAVLVLATTACGGGTPGSAASAPTTAAATATTAATTAAAATAVAATTAATPAAPSAATSSASSGSAVPLVVYSAQGYDQAMVNAFQKATGIPTKLVDDSTGPLLARIQAEKSNPQWGLLWVDGDEAFAALDQQGLLLRNYEPTVQWTANGQSVLPKDQSYVPTGVTIAGALIYNSTAIKTPPTSWQDLTQPAYKGIVGMNNPSISGPTFPFVAGMMAALGGESAGQQFYTQLKANGLHVFDTNGVTLNALKTGQIKLAIVQSSAAIGAALKDPTLKVAYPSKVTLLPSVIGIDAHVSGQEQQEAKQFAAFVLSPAGQQVMLSGDKTGDSLYWPIVSGVSPQSMLPDLTTLPVQTIDPTVWGPKEAEINQWFTQNIVQ